MTRTRSLTVFSCIVAGLVAGALVASVRFGPTGAENLPELGTVPPITLIDSQNQMFETDRLNGEIWTLNFFFTSCPAVCPAVMGRLSEIGKTLPDLNMVSITVDSENDTPDILNEYAQKYPIGPDRWRLLTGDGEYIDDLRKNHLRLDTGDAISMHTTRVLLIDREGRIRGYYQGVEDQAMKQLLRDAQMLIADRGGSASS